MREENSVMKILQKIWALSQNLIGSGHQVEAAVALLDGGATVPFIARYRKDVTGNLSDAQLRIPHRFRTERPQ